MGTFPTCSAQLWRVEQEACQGRTEGRIGEYAAGHSRG
jgi:hypothetical protein